MLRFLKNILQLLVNPGKGWEDISHDGEDPEALCRRGFYPLLAITALSCFALLMRPDTDHSIAAIMQAAAITFSGLFATMFLAQFAISATWSKFSDREHSQKRTSTFVVYNLGVMAIIAIITNLVPFDLAVLHFLPIYVGLLIWKSQRYMGVEPDKAVTFMIVGICSIIFPVYILDTLFKILVPGVQ